ncbi:MAG: hypothetical protein CVV02_16250 [Firmicutes bacterium HGW-Firmicutes-7]|nr:MAG: hypothetical protein CVV02_16250 [Firmicutes bacterium HGW-Firmicutes-7]
MKKLVSLIILCLCMTSVSAMATEAPSSNLIEKKISADIKYVELAQVSGFLSINSLGKATICANASTASNNVTKTVVVADLMQYKNGGWIKYKTWTETNYKDYADLMSTYYVPKGYQYKVVATVTVYDKYGVELDSTTDSTPTVIY